MNFKNFITSAKSTVHSSARNILQLAKIFTFSILAGLFGGVIGAVFNLTIEFVTELRTEHGFFVFFLPLGGVLIALLYRAFRVKHDRGTNLIIDAVSKDSFIPFYIAPLVLVSTAITHLFGGSSGKEGAALQIGGELGELAGRVCRLKQLDMRTAVLCGMSAMFAALFGTPIAAAIFVAEFVAIGAMNYAALLPCVISSFVAVMITHLLGIVEEPLGVLPIGLEIGAPELLLIIVITLAVVVVSVAFCILMHKTHDISEKLFKNNYLRVFIGGLIIVALTLIPGGRDYNGSGIGIISAALAGEAVPWAFALKMIFTAITLGFGFKGGEIFPSFFIGATLACTVSGLIGFDPMLGAALGMICMFCCVTNSPIASIVMSVELFGAEYFFPFALVCIVGYVLSGNHSLYDSQKILYSKLDGISQDGYSPIDTVHELEALKAEVVATSNKK